MKVTTNIRAGAGKPVTAGGASGAGHNSSDVYVAPPVVLRCVGI